MYTLLSLDVKNNAMAVRASCFNLDQKLHLLKCLKGDSILHNKMDDIIAKFDNTEVKDVILPTYSNVFIFSIIVW